MLELIVGTARGDERVRAVVLNGSRANPHARRDCFQDFDIVYYVSDVAPFWENRAWIERFGEILILEMPEAMQYPPPTGNGHFIYLMQFADGNRIDLSLVSVDEIHEAGRDSLSVLLLDKDGIVGAFGAPNESDYIPKPPSAKIFGDCCNEFWWVSTYVAKGLWRDEIPYAKQMLDYHVREPLTKMLEWYVGVRSGFTSNPGKCGKHLKACLEPELWAMLERTYSDAGAENTWQALFAMGDLFRAAAGAVAGHFGFAYPAGDDERVSAHLRHVRGLARDAREMY
jgi:aminoglycoside 6-adenylyltransferase